MPQDKLHAYIRKTNPTTLLINQCIHIIQLKTIHCYNKHTLHSRIIIGVIASNGIVSNKETHHKKKHKFVTQTEFPIKINKTKYML